MQIENFIHHLTRLSEYHQQIAHIQYIPASDPVCGTLEKPLHPVIQERLNSLGIDSFYAHQALAINAARNGRNVMVATASASGKTLCYNIPVLESLLADKTNRALYLFPTKALAQDQLRSLTELAVPSILKSSECDTYDGDTPQSERNDIKKHARIILTNPDMLHVGIMPNHRIWSGFLNQLKFVVVDEAHTYRGIFGSHVANIMRRLRRLCLMYGAKPQFILCSATIGNPGEHAGKLTGLDFELVERDGAPHGSKSFVFWNPPLDENNKDIRKSSNSEATMLFTELIRHDIRSLVFTRSRKLTELVYKYSRDNLTGELADRIKPYRAGYFAEDRRQIEKELFNGTLLGAVATTALELGIDIGDLEATVLTGYPGSIASTWQQAGRSGRSGSSSLSFLVGMDNPLDQYFMNNPDAFFDKPYENALINAGNENILKRHLVCAAWEKPLTDTDKNYFGETFYETVSALGKEGVLKKVRNAWHLSPQISHPAQHVSIRSASNINYAVLDASRGYAMLEEVSDSNAFFQLHDGAVYLHQGDPYFVKQLDIEKHIAIVVPSTVPYYTQCKDVTDLHIIRMILEKQVGEVKVCFGKVDVTTSVLGYRKKMHYTEEIVGDEFLELPPMQFVTEALWFDIPQKAMDEMLEQKRDIAGGLHATEHAAIALLPLFALCDRNDIGGVSTEFHPDSARAQIFIYDAYPGGIGIARRGYDSITDLWSATLKVIRECPCMEGCPSCIQSPKCGNNNEPLDKGAAIILLNKLLGK